MVIHVQPFAHGVRHFALAAFQRLEQAVFRRPVDAVRQCFHIAGLQLVKNQRPCGKNLIHVRARQCVVNGIMMTFHEITNDGLVPALHLHGGHRLGAVSKTKPGGHACQIGADRTVRGTGIGQRARRETGILTEPGGLLDDADNQMRHGEFHPCRPLRTIGVADDDMQPAEFIRIRVRFVTRVDHGARPRRRR